MSRVMGGFIFTVAVCAMIAVACALVLGGCGGPGEPPPPVTCGVPPQTCFPGNCCWHNNCLPPDLGLCTLE